MLDNLQGSTLKLDVEERVFRYFILAKVKRVKERTRDRERDRESVKASKKRERNRVR